MSRTLPRYAFGPFLFDPAERRLSRDGRVTALPPKALDVLAVLVGQAGHLVTKDEILAAAWPGVVVEESALSVAVSRLRAALGEQGRGFIETVPGHGYRFVAPVAPYPVDEGAAPYPLDGESAAAGPHVEDVIPTLTLTGDGVGHREERSSPPTPPASRPPAPAPITRSARLAWPIGLLAVAGVLVLLAMLATWSERSEEAAASASAAGHEVPAEALLAYSRGRTLWESRRGETMNEALTQFKLATTLDSSFAAAYVGEAQIYAIGYRTGPAAETALARALALDSTLGEAWATRGFVRAFQHWDWDGAEAAFARAVALDPDNVTTLQWLASLRMVQRRLPEAEALLRRAIALRPDYAALHADLCEVLSYQQAYEDALGACNRALALQPEHPMAWQHRFWLRLAAPEGRAEVARLLTRDHRVDFDAYRRARLYARLGQQDSALAYVERTVAERVLVAPFMHPDPFFDSVRGTPRWQAAVRRMGLE